MKEKGWISVSSRNNFWWHYYSSLDLNSSNSNYLTILPQVGKYNSKLACTLGEHLRSKFSDLLILSLCDKLRKAVKKKVDQHWFDSQHLLQTTMEDRDRRQTETQNKASSAAALWDCSTLHWAPTLGALHLAQWRRGQHCIQEPNKWMNETTLKDSSAMHSSPSKASPWASPACHFKAASKLWNLPILSA